MGFNGTDDEMILNTTVDSFSFNQMLNRFWYLRAGHVFYLQLDIGMKINDKKRGVFEWNDNIDFGFGFK
jgi:hypothetical protein